MNSVEYPISPRAGTLKIRRVCPFPSACISTISPLRCPNDSITAPTLSSGTSTCTRSTGSQSTPSILRMITSGLDTCNSNPSRRKFSIRIDKCSSPRPLTTQESLVLGSTRNETSVSNCCINLSSNLRAVTNLPSLPANGELLTKKVICNVGSSM